MVDEAEAAARGQRRRCRGHQKEEGHGGAAPVTKKVCRRRRGLQVSVCGPGDVSPRAAQGQLRAEDLSSEYRCRGQDLFEHPAGGLEAGLNLQAIVIGLQFLFLEPNASDPLNKEAAEDLRSNREGFKTECLMGRPCGRVMYAFGVASFSDTDDVGMGAYGLDMNDYTFNIRHDR
ncbi:hypothetical protein EYC84_005891 [Monilinia fructicola]|nr:hypothetical protein EYC84_005891 [Monilinia fructicola]